jgi:hypothetical protein
MSKLLVDEISDADNTGPVTVTDGLTVQGAFTSLGIDDNATSTAMTLDSSGNLLVGKTSSSATTQGIEARADGRLWVSTSSDDSIFNRAGTDGGILSFRKNGTTVGSIGTISGDMYEGAGAVGLRYNGGGATIIPVNPDNAGSTRDNAINIGASYGRFKDLYLSGGVYLGGTGSANLLDDYEEGVHTCTVTMTSGTCSLYANYDKIKYTKVGRLVTIQGQIRVQSVSAPSGAMIVSMPFSIDTTADEGANISGSVVRTYLGNAPTGGLFLHGTMVFNTGAGCSLLWSKSGSVTVDHVPVANEYLAFNFSYAVA